MSLSNTVADSPMFLLVGRLLHVFKTPAGTKKTGEQYEGQDKVQILGNIPLPDGSHRLDLVTLTTKDAGSFEPFLGQLITCPLGFYSFNKTVGFFVPAGGKPQIFVGD